MGLADMVWRYRSRMSMAGQHLGGTDIYWGLFAWRLHCSIPTSYVSFGVLLSYGMGMG